MSELCVPHNGPHDLGGREGGGIGAIDTSAGPPLQHWEVSIHALLVALSTRNPPMLTTDELRRGVEALEECTYNTWSYYEKWSASMATILLERGIITSAELDKELFGDMNIDTASQVCQIPEGMWVQVCAEDKRSRWRKPHLRCPGYIFGRRGRVVKYVGQFEDPYFLAFRGVGPKQHLYTVEFKLGEIWAAPSGGEAIGSEDVITLDIYHTWLTPTEAPTPTHDHDHDHGHDHDHHVDHVHRNLADHGHGHGHDHGHVHEERAVIEATALEREGVPTPGQDIGEALLRTLYSKEVVTPGEINRRIETIHNAGKVMAGADLVVKSWLDPEFKARLLTDGADSLMHLCLWGLY